LPPDQPPFDLLDTVSRISAQVGRSVDLVDLRRASDVLRREVLEHGVVAYQADPNRVLEWEAQAMTRYGHYRREVAPILEAFERTGVGFAPRARSGNRNVGVRSARGRPLIWTQSGSRMTPSRSHCGVTNDADPIHQERARKPRRAAP
jgi:hypothetical protein